MDNRMRTAEGSITVFMTFLFLLLFAVTGTALDSARFFGSTGYIAASAQGANIAIYGNYNRELFQEYGLLGYGGWAGIDVTDWEEEYQGILIKNLAERPVREDKGILSIFSPRYSSVYQLDAVHAELVETGFLGEEEQFLRQLDAWLKTTAVRDITKKLLERIQGTETGDQKELLDGLEETARAEELGRQQEEQMRQEALQQEVGGKEKQDDPKEEEENKGQTNSEEGEGNQTIKKQEKNPLEFLKELLQDGILLLVCDEKDLAENEVPSCFSGETFHSPQGTDGGKGGSSAAEWASEKSGIKILKGLLAQSETLWDEEMLSDQEKKGKLLVYASQMFDSYVSRQGRSAPYGLEYLISGKENQKDAFASVISRLFLVRTLLNYIYVSQDPVLQEESLVTATAIAAPLAAEAFIPVIQQSILLVLCLEETCVDITALLEGRLVPLIKSQTSFKMKYEELCLGSKSLFHQKAMQYPQAEQDSLLQDIQKGFGYNHYLWLFLLMTSWDSLYQRSLDLIQYDLREKYNQTFTLSDCICQTKVQITYGMPLLSPLFLIRHPASGIGEEKQRNGLILRRISTSYRYH